MYHAAWELLASPNLLPQAEGPRPKPRAGLPLHLHLELGDLGALEGLQSTRSASGLRVGSKLGLRDSLALTRAIEGHNARHRTPFFDSGR